LKVGSFHGISGHAEDAPYIATARFRAAARLVVAMVAPTVNPWTVDDKRIVHDRSSNNKKCVVGAVLFISFYC
jgi:hypothetical protein